MNSKPAVSAAIPATRPGKRRQILGAVIIVLGYVSQVVALQVLLDQPRNLDFERLMSVLAIPLALVLSGGGILLWGIVDGIKAMNK